MFTAPVKRHAFTLLEITLAVAILGLMAVSIYRFVSTNLVAVRVSADVPLATQLTAERESFVACLHHDEGGEGRH